GEEGGELDLVLLSRPRSENAAAVGEDARGGAPIRGLSFVFPFPRKSRRAAKGCRHRSTSARREPSAFPALRIPRSRPRAWSSGTLACRVPEGSQCRAGPRRSAPST